VLPRPARRELIVRADAAPSKAVRFNVPPLTRRATLALLALTAITTAWVVPSAPSGAAVHEKRERKCNGHAEYCGRRLDQIAFPTTHNSTAARDSQVLFPNQRHTMSRQLRDGIRGFQIDAFLGTVRKLHGRQIVFTDITPRVRSTLEADLGPEAVRTASRIRKQLGTPARNARYGVYLCHNWCELGAVTMADEARDLAHFLKRHPDEVVLWVVQDERVPNLVAVDFYETGGLFAVVDAINAPEHR